MSPSALSEACNPTFQGNVRDSGRLCGCLAVNVQSQAANCLVPLVAVQGAVCTGRVKHGLPPSQRSAPCETTTSSRHGLGKSRKRNRARPLLVPLPLPLPCLVRHSCAEESRFRLRGPRESTDIPKASKPEAPKPRRFVPRQHCRVFRTTRQPTSSAG